MKTTNIEKQYYPSLISILYMANTCKWQTFTVYTVHIHYKNWLKVISCVEQIIRLLVAINHKNIQELASLSYSCSL